MAAVARVIAAIGEMVEVEMVVDAEVEVKVEVEGEGGPLSPRSEPGSAAASTAAPSKGASAHSPTTTGSPQASACICKPEQVW